MDAAIVRVHHDIRADGAVVAHVAIDNAAKLNALSSPLMEMFAATLADLSEDPALRAVVLTGGGTKAFVGGADIGEMGALHDAVSARAFITRVHRCCAAVRACPVPVIARIQGYAFGAGLELAAACDLRVAADGAVFGMPEVRLGIPSVVEAALLPLLVGWGRARRLLLLGESIGAAEAERWGLVERVVPAAELDAAVEEWVAAVLASGPNAVRLQKALIARWEDLPLRDAVAAGIDSFATAWDSDEPSRAMAAFMAAKRGRPSS
jgi:enoyl-CoA hydratase/carnithine racemase